jgi:hypothetical protein
LPACCQTSAQTNSALCINEALFFGKIPAWHLSYRFKTKLHYDRPAETTANFIAHNRAVIRQYERLPRSNLGSYRLTSPASKVIVLRLEDVIELLPAHEQRHLQQALRVMQTDGLPR